jgi:hypothetical protein
MIRKLCAGLVVAATIGLSSSVTAAPAVKSYQVTGPVLELTDTKIVVENKDKEKWELARSADTKVTGDLKVGSKVTIKYTMTAADVTVK